MMVQPIAAPRRLESFDMARGLAMFGVLISHFGLVIERDQLRIANQLYLIGKFASPTFMLVSGVMLGLLLAHPDAEARRLKFHLLDRALFLLVVGHPLIALALHHRGLPMSRQWVHSFMTDTIAISIIIGVYLVPRMSRWQRLFAALAMYTCSWLLVILWMPHGLGVRVVKEFLVGTIEPNDPYAQSIFSIVPWAAVYFVGTVIGERLPVLDGQGRRRSGRLFLAGGLIAMGAGLAAKVTYLYARPTAWHALADIPRPWFVLYNLTDLFDKYPPGPAYLLFYGGMGAALIGCCLLAVEYNRLPTVREAAATVGRASLVVFVVSYYVLYRGVAYLPLRRTALLPLYFLASAGILWCVAWAWNRWLGNRFLTVGLRRISARWRAPASEVVPVS